MDREPCPWRVVDDAGGAFIFGLAGGTIWNFFGGIRNAPKGHRISHAIARVKARTPILGGSFAVWGVLFSCFDCTFTYYRKKEDPWNAIFSGAATGGLLAARAGVKAAGKNALVGGVILAAIEGLNVVVSRVVMPMMEKQQMEAGIPIDMLEPPVDPLRPYTKSIPLWTAANENHQSLAYQGPSSSQQQLSTGIDLDSVDSFDPRSDEWEQRQRLEEEEKKAAEAAAKLPFWKRF